jgi:hypothetical protein
MTHDEVRDLAGGVADGEAGPTPEYETHLATCAACSGYVASLARLSALTAALPRESAPAALPQRVRHRIGQRIRRRRLATRLLPALAVATAAAMVVTVLPGPASFPVPGAGAAEPLLRLRSLYVERTVSDGSTERIWWRAPGSVRVERHTVDGLDTVTIRTPGSAYDGGLLTTGLPPEIALPEPISPTVALLGTDRGAGPSVAGRPTRRYELTIGGDTRVAYVDAGVALRDDERLVLSKTGGATTKLVTVVRLNEPVPDSLFAAPDGATRTTGGFVTKGLGSLRVDPVRRPAGFAVVTAGRGPDGDAVLFARGSLPVLVRTGGLAATGRGENRTVTLDGRTYLASVDLYAPPAVQVTRHGVTLTVSAPLPLDALAGLAARMYPE